MSQQQQPKGIGAATPEQDPDEKVTICNSDPFPRVVDFGVAPDGQRRTVQIPAAKVDKLHTTTVGQAGWTRAEWEETCKHPTARHLVARGALSLKGRVG